MENSNAQVKQKRSVKMKPDEKRKLKSLVRKCDCAEDAANAIGITRLTLRNVLRAGSGHQSTIEKIRAIINA